MTPSEIAEAARRRYNAVNDTFFSDAEIYDLIFEAETQLAIEANVIRNAYETTSVADQQAYPWPTNAHTIYRVTYDGDKLYKNTMREDDVATLSNSATTTTGTPHFYYDWNKTLYLRPIPATAGVTIKVYTYDLPQAVTAASTLEVGAEYHNDLIYHILAEMAFKDKEWRISDRYRDQWDKRKLEIRKFEARRKRGDAPAHVHAIGTLNIAGNGNV